MARSAARPVDSATFGAPLLPFRLEANSRHLLQGLVPGENQADPILGEATIDDGRSR